jgi:ribosomal protein L3 glutamine methyltransferase
MTSNKYTQAFAKLETIRDVFRFSLSEMNRHKLFYGHGTESAWDDALALIFDLLHLPHSEHAVFMDTKLTDEEKQILSEKLLQRIVDRKPIPYLTHVAWFAELPFYVDENVIIPRSPIAELIKSDFAPWKDIDNVYQILDLCTGSGCIAIACAYYFPEVSVDAVDISPAALSVAQKNVNSYQFNDRVTLIESDLFENVPPTKYDLILSNPPYVDNNDMESLPEEFLHEPKLALAAGHDGLAIVCKILQQAGKYLNDDGILIVEVGNSEEALVAKYPQVPFLWLDLAQGGQGIFLLTKAQLDEHHSDFVIA